MLVCIDQRHYIINLTYVVKVIRRPMLRMVLNGGFVPHDHLAMSGDSFVCHNLGW